jgi:hypothetical protein
MQFINITDTQFVVRPSLWPAGVYEEIFETDCSVCVRQQCHLITVALRGMPQHQIEHQTEEDGGVGEPRQGPLTVVHGCWVFSWNKKA